MKVSSYLYAAGVAVSGVAAHTSDNFNQQCADFAKTLNVGNGTVWFTQAVAAGTNLTFPDNNVTCTRPYQIVSADICRVALRIPTSNRSEISMEAWLPRNWSGRFLSTGNGGISGCIQYEDMDYTAALGFSTVGANNGHNGTGGEAFLNNPDVVLDFAYRSVHTGVVVGKEISQQFYGKAHNKSYYLGCSTGGRQGFKEAQSFPDDFDGIVAGAPAFAFNNLTSWSGHFYTIIKQAGPAGTPAPAMWPVIHQDILNQCDKIDGYVDGIIEDPLLCQYRPESLICPPGNSTGVNTTCLTGAQAATVRKIFEPLYGENGTLVFPRMQPGSEIGAPVGAYLLYYLGQPFPYTTGWFANVVYSNPNWDPATLGPKDYSAAAALNPGDIQTWNGDLAPFQKKGGKILTYHGQQDSIITSDNSPRYYDHVAETMSLPSSSLDSFYRFFRISGMGHCGGGPGATFIGNTAAANASLSPDQNVLMSMVRWVEQGQAPDKILGTKFVNDTKALGVDFQRAHCRYPLRNVYNGTGNPKLPASWNCVV